MTAMFNAAKPVDILLVEDNPDDVELTREALEEGRLANELHVARTAENAMDWLHDRGEPRPNLILLDINLPGMSGLDFLQKIKTEGAFEDIPVVVLTTSQAEEDIDEAYRLRQQARRLRRVHRGGPRDRELLPDPGQPPQRQAQTRHRSMR